MIIGFTIIKNAKRENYPIDLVIRQHRKLFDIHYIGVPLKEQDLDGTREFVLSIAKECGANVELMELDWEGSAAWTKESLDKILQKQMVNHIAEVHSRNDWVIKIDADEFYSERDFDIIRELIDLAKEGLASWNSIITGYLQFCGSLDYTVYDPTEQVFHIFQNTGNAEFLGNDAMMIAPDEPIYAFAPIKLHHIGYVKEAEKISTRIKEHMTLNASVYQRQYNVDDENVRASIEKYRFEFPAHKINAKLWPLGIGVLFGNRPNETEYKPFNSDDLPMELYTQRDSKRYFTPTF